ncbi:tRNA-dependent cyclodipeptide synthase [Nocardia altamirensis]|uniref:tRNA-dependent cyclodipeptide synthase n=1 Tax=Nocardia altamirensis TaxID=472158 RepID=UPI00084005C8|nr:tRNA-dependent cyclodipeptide synthase [Nocardia altamirensis]
MQTALELTALPLTPNCAELFARRDHVLLGISPFNSYFKRARIAELTRWAVSEFAYVQFHLPDVPGVFTLRALGLPEHKARKRALENGLKMRNRIRDGLASAGLSGLDARVVDWAYLEANPVFVDLLREATELFAYDAAFRDLCLETTRNVLRHRLADGSEPTIEQCELAAQYFLADIPLLVDTAGIVGSETSLYAYHRGIPFIDALFRRELPMQPVAGQGYLTVLASGELDVQPKLQG